ncbi:hypothetical protein B0J14DRAFT_655184 [Halenospora varia]|nr:hypothetical protein B0J14DRAFT_655184 [Halenospora varia]
MGAVFAVVSEVIPVTLQACQVHSAARPHVRRAGCKKLTSFGERREAKPGRVSRNTALTVKRVHQEAICTSTTTDHLASHESDSLMPITCNKVAARRLFTARILSNERKFSPDDVVPCGNHTGGTAALDRLNCHLSRTFKPGVDRVVKSDKQTKFHDTVTFHIFSAARRRKRRGLGAFKANE